MGNLEPTTFESLERAGHSLVTQLRRRLALLAIEVSEEEVRFARALGWQLLAIFFLCLTVGLFAVLVIAAFWQSPHRLAAIGWACGISGAATGTLWWIYRDRMRSKPVLFSQTLNELEKDAEALNPRRTDHG